MSKEVKRLNSRHKRMIEALVLEGMTGNEVSQKFGITPTRISLLRKDPLWMAEEDALRGKFRSENMARIQSLVPAAIKVLEESIGESITLEDGKIVPNDPKVRIQASKEILSRAGIKTDEEIEKPTTHITLYAPP